MVRTTAIFERLVAILISTAALLPTFSQGQDTNQKVEPFKAQGLHGDVHFGGAIVASPCRVSLDSLEQTIDMGEQNTSHFHNVGNMTPPVHFVIHIEDCLRSHYIANPYSMSHDIDTQGSPVRIAFFGDSAGSEAPELLSGTGLRGVGLRLMDSEGHIIALGQDSDPFPLRLDNDTLTFRVALQSYAPQRNITLGHFHALSTFRLSYQ